MYATIGAGVVNTIFTVVSVSSLWQHGIHVLYSWVKASPLLPFISIVISRTIGREVNIWLEFRVGTQSCNPVLNCSPHWATFSFRNRERCFLLLPSFPIVLPWSQICLWAGGSFLVCPCHERGWNAAVAPWGITGSPLFAFLPTPTSTEMFPSYRTANSEVAFLVLTKVTSDIIAVLLELWVLIQFVSWPLFSWVIRVENEKGSCFLYLWMVYLYIY